MAHPYSGEASKSHSEKMKRMLGRKDGGRASDEAQDRKLVSKMLKEHDRQEAHGEKAKRKPGRYARGGKVKGKTQINIMVHPGQQQPGGAMPPPGGPPMMPPGMPPHPPMIGGPGMPPPGMMPPGGPPGMPPMIRKTGGRAFKRGGSVKEESLRAGTKVQHHPGKNDLKDVGRKPVITKARGGSIESEDRKMANVKDGAGGGEGRLEKIKIQRKA